MKKRDFRRKKTNEKNINYYIEEFTVYSMNLFFIFVPSIWNGPVKHGWIFEKVGVYKKKFGVSVLHANELFPSILELAFRFGVYQVHSVAHFIWAWLSVSKANIDRT